MVVQIGRDVGELVLPATGVVRSHRCYHCARPSHQPWSARSAPCLPHFVSLSIAAAADGLTQQVSNHPAAQDAIH